MPMPGCLDLRGGTFPAGDRTFLVPPIRLRPIAQTRQSRLIGPVALSSRRRVTEWVYRMSTVPIGDLELMQVAAASEILAALIKPSHLTIFRSLVRAGPAGVLSSELERRTGYCSEELETGLASLREAGLVVRSGEDDGRRDAVNFSGTRELIAFLIEDCCGDREQICSLLEVAKAFQPATPATRSDSPDEAGQHIAV